MGIACGAQDGWPRPACYVFRFEACPSKRKRAKDQFINYTEPIFMSRCTSGASLSRASLLSHLVTVAAPCTATFAPLLTSLASVLDS